MDADRGREGFYLCFRESIFLSASSDPCCVEFPVSISPACQPGATAFLCEFLFSPKTSTPFWLVARSLLHPQHDLFCAVMSTGIFKAWLKCVYTINYSTITTAFP